MQAPVGEGGHSQGGGLRGQCCKSDREGGEVVRGDGRGCEESPEKTCRGEGERGKGRNPSRRKKTKRTTKTTTDDVEKGKSEPGLQEEENGGTAPVKEG